MSLHNVVKDATSVILDIFVLDSSSTTGAGLTGLVFNSGSLACYYHRNTASSAVQVVLVTMTAGTFTSLGFKEIDATNMPGWYQLCLPNAAFVTGADMVSFHLKGATNMAPFVGTVQLRPAAADVTAIASDTTAPGNLKLAYNGTGYADGTAQGGGSTYITLAAGESATDNLLSPCMVSVIAGTGNRQSRYGYQYTGASKRLDVRPAWTTNPDATSTYVISPLPDILRAIVVDSAGDITAQQALSIILAALAGEWTADGTFKTPDGTATRIVGTAASSVPFRDNITLTPSS